MAIIDRREIEFDEKALISVIAGSLQRAQAIGLPALRPTSIGFDPQANTMRVEYGTQPTVSLSSAHLGAFLVSYCVRARIPVPRGADKNIRIQSGSVVLAFNTHFADPLGAW
ncbi:MAG TPA: hypothetical protein VHT74_01080 [Acetobacteraceae bacterium]|nr:hypothetical protein [Acetobacteraceae bacterium]